MNGITHLIAEARKLMASDLHLVAGMPPFIRVNGEILSLPGFDLISADGIEGLLFPLIDEAQRRQFDEQWSLCFSRSDERVGYFRVSLYRRDGRAEASIRLGITRIPSFEELGLPRIVEEIARRPSGLILITGSTGSGKTTTFNAIIDLINRERRSKIITIEDPIEYVHRPVRSLVIQQEVGQDVKSFPAALIHSLRQDPDVIGLGELRELDTIASALTAAETGHLVLTTLHTNDAVSTISRTIDVFPSHQQAQVRFQLAQTLQAIVNQRLLPRIDQPGRVMACEILIATDAVKNLIRENKVHQLLSVITTGSAVGMQPLDARLKDLYEKGIISFDTMDTHIYHQPGKPRNTEKTA